VVLRTQGYIPLTGTMPKKSPLFFTGMGMSF
jgi:hypothetical protein